MVTDTLFVVRTDQVTTIRIVGRFDFNNQAQFREACRKELAEKSSIVRIVVDLSETDYIDSYALGVLLLMREEFDQKEGSIELANAKPAVRSILHSATFQRLFKMT